ncbi:MAG: histidine--tRNA ligase [Thiomargarita sp.]|nr:histidine--tRNA ligase [Thiomargarita sp.]
MSKKIIKAIRGINDILPTQTPLWQHIEVILRQVVESYGYKEIRLPLLEMTELFSRSIGEVTDIVEKEMFSFIDRNNDSLTLRPEGTACCVRAGIENGLFYNQIQRLWYIGPMFRHERPQQGRYRQFHQIGAEAYGIASPDIDVEMILITARFWQKLGLKNLELQINSLGNTNARMIYRQQLLDYFSGHYEQLDTDSQRRLQTNPLRILDSKNPDMHPLIESAPKLLDYLDNESKEDFAILQQLLDEVNITYQVNPRLVRGLDYYNKTVFEWLTKDLGAQGTVCAGGRYDKLVGQLGGKQATPAVGFAMGLERLIILLAQESAFEIPNKLPQVYFVTMGAKAVQKTFSLSELLRNELPQLRLVTHCGGGSFKSQFKQADKSGAKIAIILGEDEVEKQQVTIKHLREKNRSQLSIAQSELVNYLKSII